MAFTTAQLKSELRNDPGGLGYAALITAGAIGALSQALNLVRSGSAADGKSYTVFSQSVSAAAIMGSINATEWTASVPSTNNWLALLCFLVGGSVDATVANDRAVFAKIFAGMPNTLTALTAAAQRNGSRAEALWGAGTAVADADVLTALNS